MDVEDNRVLLRVDFNRLCATAVIGGGSSAEVVQQMGLAGKMTHVSAGGGASPRFLEAATSPGVKVLLDEEQQEQEVVK